ncbi:unnamed protein product [Diamesa serratosioi]
MEEPNEHFHPNWKALCTINLEYKRFVTSSEIESNRRNEEIVLKPGNNEDSSKVYSEILEMPSTSVEKTKLPKTRKRIVKIIPRKVEFDREVLFRLALDDDSDGIIDLIRNSNNVDINALDLYGWSALMMACCQNSVNSFGKLLELGADLKIADKKGNTAISIALKNRCNEIMDVIENFQKRANEVIEISEDEEEDNSQHFCSDCGIQISSRELRSGHESSTIHLFSCKFKESNMRSFGIPQKNRGFQMLKRFGWSGNTGLGAKQDGKLYPIKTVLRKQRTGLGIEQTPAKISHFGPNDPRSIKYNPPPRVLTRREICTNDLNDKKLNRKIRRQLS